MTDRKRILTPEELMPEYEKLLAEGAELPLIISGSSMIPFLAPGCDKVYLKAVDRPLKKGDVVFYKRAGERYILHRVFRVEEGKLWFVGDGQDEVEGPLSEKCAFAYVTKALRRGKTECPGTFWWNFFAGPWLHLVGYRRKVMKIYSELKRFLGSK